MIVRNKIVNPIEALIQAGGLTESVEDNFFGWLDAAYKFGDHLSEKIDAHIAAGKINLLDFSYLDKDPGESGAWIKIRTERGIELHFAKRAKKKIDYLNESHRLLRRSYDRNDPQVLENRMQQLAYLDFLTKIEASPVFVRYQRTKSKEAYLTPSQYEIVEDINEYIDAFLSVKSKNLKMHTIWNERNREQVFYLQSRGISRERAQLLASMEQCWFSIDIVGGCDEINEQIRSTLVVTP